MPGDSHALLVQPPRREARAFSSGITKVTTGGFQHTEQIFSKPVYSLAHLHTHDCAVQNLSGAFYLQGRGAALKGGW